MSKVVDQERENRVARGDKLDGLRADKETEVRALLNNLRQLAEGTGGTEDKEALSIKQQVAVTQYAEYRRELMRVQFEMMRARNSLKTAQALQASIEEPEIPAYEVDQCALADPMQPATGRQAGAIQADDRADRQHDGRARQQIGLMRKAQSERDMVQQQVRRLGKEDIATRSRSGSAPTPNGTSRRRSPKCRSSRSRSSNSRRTLEKQGKEVDAHRQQFDRHRDGSRQKLKELNEVLASIAAEREKLKVELNSTPRIILLCRRRSSPRRSTGVRCGWP